MNPIETILQKQLDSLGYEDYRVVFEINGPDVEDSKHDSKKAELIKELGDIVDDLWGVDA